MPTERDPRRDPRPGDKTQPEACWPFTVLDRSGHKIKVRARGEPFEMSVGRWRAMNFNATVLHTAPEE